MNDADRKAAEDRKKNMKRNIAVIVVQKNPRILKY
jgi:hypothetical protein